MNMRVSLLTLGLASAGIAHADNLVPNPDFDAGLEGWTQIGTGTATADDSIGLPNPPSAHLVVDSTQGIGLESSCMPVDDGDNYDFPDVTSYDMRRSLEDYLTNGVFTPGQFTAPVPGTTGNQKPGQFRQPNFAQTDLAFYKRTRFVERLNLELRLEFYNIFNNENLYLSNNLASPGFGKAISQQLPRWWQVGAKLSF